MDQADQSLIEEIARLRNACEQAQLPEALSVKTTDILNRLERSVGHGGYSDEYERTVHYLEWLTSLPWAHRTEDTIDLPKAKQVMDQHHYGLEPIKQRFLEHLSILKLNYDQGREDVITRAPILCLVGLAGTGKTTFASALAEAMGRQFARIPFGGMGSARDLRGQSRLHSEAEPGQVIKAMRIVGSRNPVILLDEIDRVADEARSDIMGTLLELLDPGQNKAFIDHYIDFPFNLNEVLFIATSNNTDNISTAVLNRLEVIHMPTYSDEEKTIIGKQYLLPNLLKEAGLSETAVQIPEDMWPKIIRPLGYDSGIRMLRRTMEAMVRKAAFQIVSANASHIIITDDNFNDFIEQF